MDPELAHLRELVNEWREADRRALKLQAKEYKRRLSELNNAHERADQVLKQTLSREMYEVDRKAIDTWRDMVNTDLTAMKAVSAANARFFAAVVGIMTLLFAVVTIGMQLWGK